MEHRHTADATNTYRVAVYIDVSAATEDEAKSQVEEMTENIPNSYIGEVIDLVNWLENMSQIVS